MAIGDDALEGLDLSVLDNITVKPEEGDTKTQQKEEAEPSIFEPQLKIQEVDEIPEDKKEEEEPKAEETPEEEKVVEDEPTATKEEDKEEPVSETEAESDTEEEVSALRVFAEMQRDKGLIDFKDDEFEADEEWLLSKVGETVETKVQDYKDSMPEEIKYLLDNYEAGVPLNNLLNMQSKD